MKKKMASGPKRRSTTNASGRNKRLRQLQKHQSRPTENQTEHGRSLNWSKGFIYKPGGCIIVCAWTGDRCILICGGPRQRFWSGKWSGVPTTPHRKETCTSMIIPCNDAISPPACIAPSNKPCATCTDYLCILPRVPLARTVHGQHQVGPEKTVIRPLQDQRATLFAFKRRHYELLHVPWMAVHRPYLDVIEVQLAENTTSLVRSSPAKTIVTFQFPWHV